MDRQLRIDPACPASASVRVPAAAHPSEAPADGPPLGELPVIDQRELMQLYLDRQFGPLTRRLLDLLDHYRQYQYRGLDAAGQSRADALAEVLLFLLSKQDFEVPNDLAEPLVGLNHVIANVVAMSCWKTADAHLRIVARQPRNFVRLLALHSARGSLAIDPKVLFDGNAELASTWYLAYPLCSAGWPTELTWENVRRHWLGVDDRLSLRARTLLTPTFFECTDVVPEAQDRIKTHLNQCVRTEVDKYVVRNRPSPGRIAILTAKWFPASAVHRSSSPFIRELAARHDLVLVHLGPKRSDLDTSLFSEVRNVVVAEEELKLDDVLDNDFQVAYYPDVGMNAESIWLSNMRLAPIQAMGYGHPVSTFGSRIDYFLGGSEVEIAADAQRNYSERLVLFPGIGSHPVYPDYKPRHPATTDEAILVNCSWGSAKINYPMMMNLKAIQQRAGRPVRFRFYSGWALERYNTLIPHLQAMGSVLGKEAIVVSNRPYPAYMEHMEEGDLALDSYPFGGYNSVVDSLHLGKPIVTYEGTEYYNRAASALLRRVGLDELVATNDQEYVEKAVRLIQDDVYRRHWTDVLRMFDLRATLIDTEEPKYFRQAIDYLIDNHETLREDPSREPIFISCAPRIASSSAPIVRDSREPTSTSPRGPIPLDPSVFSPESFIASW